MLTINNILLVKPDTTWALAIEKLAITYIASKSISKISKTINLVSNVQKLLSDIFFAILK
jgi:hypothetical protein